MGIYDLPATISYIKNTTSQPLYSYIGHSMGTTASYVMAAERPDIARMVGAIISLAPVVFSEHAKSPLRFIVPFADEFQIIAHLFGQDELLPQNDVLEFLAKIGCDIFHFEEVCVNIIFSLVGFDKEQFDYLQMIRKAGYPAEAHVIQTEDGYLLTLHRIPGNKDQPPVLLQHCYLCSSAAWIIAGKDKGL
ncbi:PREDICTED: lysosomal acid lipase/cholesteryl ester hydrolase-like, partial [Wasmannia auropunctata]|uniref:lysosomal acid lipase/cholesteryl ester hydrolase-like n=1 Tax=Wasmannia auropunctata TaxID=64793 RepID=UPI0005EF801D